MSRNPIKFLLVLLCLLSLMLAGGLVGSSDPGSSDVKITLDQSSALECPENRELIMICPPLDLGGAEQESNGFLDGLNVFPGLNLFDDLIDERWAEENGSVNGSGENQTNATSAGAPTNGGRQGSFFDSDIQFETVLLGGLLVVVTALIIGAIVASRRGHIESPVNLGQLLTLAASWLLWVIVGLAVFVADGFRGLRSRFASTMPNFRSVKFPSNLEDFIHTISGIFQWVITTVRSVPALLVTLGDSGRGGGGVEHRSGTTPVEDPHTLIEGEFRVQAAWNWLAENTRKDEEEKRTPQEIAHDAIARGYAQGAVMTLLQTFQKVTYGEYQLTASQVDVARENFQDLLRRAEDPRTDSGD